MSVVKTAVSFQKSLFQQIEELAEELDLSRSGLISVAVEEFIERQRNKRLLEQLNSAYEDDPQTEEAQVSKAHRKYFRQVSEADW